MSFGRGGGGRMGAFFGAEAAPPIPKERRAHTIRRIATFFKPYRLAVSAVLLTIVVTSLLGLVNPFDRRMFIVPVVSSLIGTGQYYLNNVIGQRVMQYLRNALYAHLQRLPRRFFTETRTGEIQSRLANDVGGVQSVVTDTASSITSNLAIAISTIVAMFILSWQLAVLSLALLPFCLDPIYLSGTDRRGSWY